MSRMVQYVQWLRLGRSANCHCQAMPAAHGLPGLETSQVPCGRSLSGLRTVLAALADTPSAAVCVCVCCVYVFANAPRLASV